MKSSKPSKSLEHSRKKLFVSAPSKDYSRTQRVADLLQRELSRVIKRDIQDPRLHGMTISGVHVSRDLAHAKILITPTIVTGEQDPQHVEQLLAGLNKAAGFLRRQLAESLDLRITPQLRFVYDSSIEYGAKMSALINDAVSQDQQKNKDQEKE